MDGRWMGGQGKTFNEAIWHHWGKWWFDWRVCWDGVRRSTSGWQPQQRVCQLPTEIVPSLKCQSLEVEVLICQKHGPSALVPDITCMGCWGGEGPKNCSHPLLPPQPWHLHRSSCWRSIDVDCPGRWPRSGRSCPPCRWLGRIWEGSSAGCHLSSQWASEGQNTAHVSTPWQRRAEYHPLSGVKKKTGSVGPTPGAAMSHQLGMGRNIHGPLSSRCLPSEVGTPVASLAGCWEDYMGWSGIK